ncbi:phosphopantetheine-binding protein [Corynebacterium pyruviciproducens]|uniref:phosphopantetheine-binding protein n=1 Tax=Corynebacterium pyruviciproducens TaxID=598660 RepID=UPI003982E233
MESPFSTQLRAKIAEQLEINPTELDPDVELIDQGLDSFKLVEIIEWINEQGGEADFQALSEDTRLTHWEQNISF